MKWKSLLIIAFFFIASEGQAAELYFGTQAPIVDVGAVIEVGVFVNSDTQSVNAFEGEIVYPTELLEFTMIRDAGSIIAPWIESPTVYQEQNGQGIIRFSGITPGGFTGTDGFLFSMLFKTVQAGEVEIKTIGDRVLLNDGDGTQAVLRRSPLFLTIQEGVEAPPFLLPTDEIPPEPFALVLAQDPNIFEGQWFVAFDAQDKQSGMDHYELLEEFSWWSWERIFKQTDWRFVTSPALLEDQGLRRTIFVRAVDLAGNMRTAELPATYPLAWYEGYGIWGIIILIIVMWGIHHVYPHRPVWRKSKKRERDR